MTVTVPESLQIRVDEQVCVVALSGELDVASTESLSTALRAMHGVDITVELSGLRFIDAAGLGVLVAARTSQQAAGRRLILVGANERVARVFDLCGLSEFVATG